MESHAARRIQKEFMEVISSDEAAQCGIKVELVSDDFSEFNGEIMGPPDTPYEGGNFKLEISVPTYYPYKPPEVRFTTKIWHPNISSASGIICMDILGKRWSSCLTLRAVLLSLQILLATPESSDPLEVIAAQQLIENPEMFDLTARHWTNAYAGGPSQNQDFDDKIRTLMDLGHRENLSRSVLSYCNWDLEDAITDLSPNDVGDDDDNNNNDDAEDQE